MRDRPPIQLPPDPRDTRLWRMFVVALLLAGGIGLLLCRLYGKTETLIR